MEYGKKFQLKPSIQEITQTTTSVSLNLKLIRIFIITLQNDLNNIVLNNIIKGEEYTFVFIQDSIGGRSVTFPSQLEFDGTLDLVGDSVTNYTGIAYSTSKIKGSSGGGSSVFVKTTTPVDWSTGTPGGGDTYVEFDIPGAVDYEINSVEGLEVHVDMREFHPGTYSLVDGIKIQGRVRILSAPDSELSDAQVWFRYNQGGALAKGVKKLTIPFTTVIPFNSNLTQIEEHTISTATEFTVNTNGAEYGNETIGRLVANGTITPTFTGFKKMLGSQNWDVRLGIVNLLMSFYDGTDYWYCLTQDENAVPIVLPVFVSAAMSADNTYIDVVISKASYGANDGSTEVSISNLSVVFAANGGTATDWVKSSVKKPDNTVEGSASDLTGGETTIRIFGSISGTASGVESVTISPTDGASIFDVDGNAMDSGESVSDTLNLTYSFTNTHKLVISGIGDGIKVTNNAMYPSGAYSFEIWGTTPSSLGINGACMRLIDDDDDFILSDIQIGSSTDNISVTFRSDGSNRLAKRYGSPSNDEPLSVSTKYHIIVTKGAADNYAAVKIYLNGAEPTKYSDSTVGTYSGIRALVGNVVMEIPRLNLVSFFETIEGTRVFNAELSQAEVTELYNIGDMVGLSSALQAKCVDEKLLNNNALADNIGVDGTTEGSATYTTI